MTLSKFDKNQKGLSLVELMVAMFIAAVIFAGVVNTLLASKKAYLYDDEVAFIQENSRFALEYLARELRGAGYNGGCNLGSATVANTLRPSVAASDLFKTTPIEGFEGGVSAFPASFSSDVYGSSDAFIIRSVESDGALTVTNHEGNSAIIHVSPSHDFDEGTIMMMANADCTKVGVFANTSTQTDQIQHNKGSGNGGPNCTKRLSGTASFDCNSNCGNSGQCDNSSSDDYDDGSSVFQVSAKAFYVGTSSFNDNVRSLFVRSLGNAGTVTSSELVSGIEDMQIIYGVDTEAAQPDGEADRYYLASDITQDVANLASGWVGWDRVVSARINLVMRSKNAPLTSDTTKTMPTLGTAYTDKFLYQEVSTVINLRNAALPGNPVPVP